MTTQTRTLICEDDGVIASLMDPFMTLGSGTTLMMTAAVQPDPAVARLNALVLKYQQTIFELRREVEHYRRVVRELLNTPANRDEFIEPDTRHPLQPQAATLLNSLWSADCSNALPYLDDDGDL